MVKLKLVAAAPDEIILSKQSVLFIASKIREMSLLFEKKVAAAENVSDTYLKYCFFSKFRH